MNRYERENERDFEFKIQQNQSLDENVDAAAICQNARDVALMSERSYKMFRNSNKKRI